MILGRMNSLRNKLLLLLVVALAPALAIIGYTGLEREREVVAEAHKEAILLVDAMSVQQALLVASIGTLFDTLAQTPMILEMDADNCARHFQRLLSTLPVLTNIGLFDPDGDLRCTGVPVRQFSNAGTRQFQEAVSRKRMAAGEYVLGRLTGRPSFQFAAPVLNGDGEVLAVLQVGYQLSIFDELFDRAMLPRGTVLAIIDHAGHRLYRIPDIDAYPAGEIVPDHIWELFHGGGRQGAFEALGADGRPRLFAFQNLFLPGNPAPYMTFHISIPKAEALARAHRIFVRNMAFLGFSVLAALALTWALSRHGLVRPIQRLVAVADQLGAGCLDIRTGLPPSADELGRLARAFDHMAQRLESQRDQLIRAQQDYRDIFEQAVEGMFQSGLDGRFLRVNPAMAEIFGYADPQEMIDLVTDIGVRLYVDETARDQLLDDLNRQGVVRDREVLMRRKDGSEVWVAVSARLLPATDGRAAYIEGSNLNITQRKLAEADREKLSGQLLQAQKLESVGLLAGGVAHDFNNMLQAILGHAELGLRKCTAELPITRHLEQIQDSATRSRDLVRQLLAFARKQTIAPRSLNLNDALGGMSGMLQRLIDENIELRWMPAAEACAVRIDPSQLDQILVNLVVNSRDAIQAAEDARHSRGGSITIETANVVLDASYTRTHAECTPGEYVLLSVSDTGTGMDEGTLRKAFDPYFTTKPTGQGTGLGLSTVYGIVKQNQGVVNIYSEPGSGTCVKIYLPRIHEARQCPADAAPPDVTPRGDATLLLVEDDPSILELTREVLEEQGYAVLTAPTPQAALDLVCSGPVALDLLITDVVMPGMNGRELEEQVRALRPGIKTLFMSGYTANVVVRHGILDRDTNFLQKPFTIHALLTMVQRVLGAGTD